MGPRAERRKTLRIAAGREIKDNSALTFLKKTRVAVTDSELRLANACRTQHNGQRPRNQATAECFVESRESCRMAKSCHAGSMSNARAI